MTTEEYITQAATQLASQGSTSARLDAELIVSHVLDISRARLFAKTDQTLTDKDYITSNKLLKRRLNWEPIAYITGHKEFYGLDFVVDSQVLIPRPETESMVEYVVEQAEDNARLLDVGTGSGAIACAVKHERPDMVVHASDVSPVALSLARSNAARIDLRINFFESDLLRSVTGTYDWVVANLPYVASIDDLNKDARHEPELALISGNNGLNHYYQLFEQLNSKDYASVQRVVIEAHPDQFARIQQKTWEFSQVSEYVGAFQRQ